MQPASQTRSIDTIVPETEIFASAAPQQVNTALPVLIEEKVETCAIRYGDYTFMVITGIDAQRSCNEFVEDAPDLFQRTKSVPRSPVVCTEVILGLEMTVIDTTELHTNGDIMCEALSDARNSKGR